MTIVSLSHEILSESSSVRRNILSTQTDQQSEDLLNKAKALVMAVWQGTGYATTEQVAEYYQVSFETIKKLFARNEQEFFGEVQKLSGQALQDARDILSLPSKTSQALAWTARGMLHAGLILTQSSVARVVRDLILDLVESANKVVQKSESEKRSQSQLSLQEAKEFIADFRLNHDLAIRSGNVRLQQQMETAIAQYTDVFLLAGLPNQPLIDGKPVGAVNIRYEGCIDVAIRLGLRIPKNYETALGRFVKGRVPHLLIKLNEQELKDYRTSACSGKRLAAAMYQAFNSEVEEAVVDFCKSNNF